MFRCFAISTCLLSTLVTLSPFARAADFTQEPTIAESRDREGNVRDGEEPPEGDRQFALLKKGPKPQWIWGDENAGDQYWLKREFEVARGDAEIVATCDNRMTVYLNGRKVLSGSNWESPVRKDVSKHVREGGNTLLVDAANEGGPAGFALKLAVQPKKGKTRYVVSDGTWQAAKEKDAEEWAKVATLGAMGVAPWNDVFSAAPTRLAGGERNVFQTLPGFQVELLFTVPKGELGSWVCLTTDDEGRLIASDQGGKGLCRIVPPAIGGSEPTRVERLDTKMTSCQGMLYAFGKLYCSVNGGPGSGFYVLEDTNGDDQFDAMQKLKAFRGGGEHGPHAVRLSPDGKSLYVIAGNHTNPPQDFDASRLPSNWSEDLLLPRQWDARGHARGKLAPGGWIAKTDPEGKTWEIVSSGYRNPYDMAFNADGELFAYDADMEWDMGTSWYRPTRLCHAVSGSEFGWRSGTGKWPTYYPDSVPPVVNIGPGSPVGVSFGYGARFPAKYQQALYLLDWTFGTIYAIHLQPDGASYRGVKEEFVARTPLPLTDAVVGKDGALYFTIGGRGTQSELYRVTYVGDESTEPVDLENDEGRELRKRRHSLEALHRPGKATAEQHERIRSNLGHEDRFVRYAARVALENRPVEQWRAGVFAAEDPQTVITAAIALARQGLESDQPKLLEALGRISFVDLAKQQKLELLRAYALAFVRLGEPGQATKQELAADLDRFYPSGDRELDRELSRMLVYLQSPTVVEKTLKLFEQEYPPRQAEIDELLARNRGYGGKIAAMIANQPEKQKVHYALVLRNVKYGWTLEQRKTFLEHLAALREKSGGASYKGFVDNIRKEFLENATEAERKALEGVADFSPPKVEELPKPKGPGRDWTTQGLVELAQERGFRNRDFENGRRAYAAAQCIRCHRFLGEGGATGPDLTNVAGRFSLKDLAEALVEPSKVVSDQYQAHTIVTTKGKVHSGRILTEQDGTLHVLVDPVDVSKVVEIPKSDVEEMTPSKVSLMPKDLLDPLSEEEALDLIAYLLSRGNPEAAAFVEAASE